MTSWGLGHRSVWGAVVFATGAAAAEPAATEFFEKNIRPVLVDHCYECHGGDPAKIKGGLNLTYRDGMLQGAGTSPSGYVPLCRVHPRRPLSRGRSERSDSQVSGPELLARSFFPVFVRLG